MVGKKVFFASDFHLGLDMSFQSSIEREKLIVKWLDSITDEVEELYLLGDIFDYWFEYKSGVPEGFDLFLNKIKELRERNIPVYFFTGNHDLWMNAYFEDNFGIPIIKTPITKDFNGKIIHLGHGDGLGPGDYKYKLLKKVFTNPICQSAFSLIPSEQGLNLMKYFSKRSREKHLDDHHFLGEENEWLIQYAYKHLKSNVVDYFLFGHRHLPIEYQMKQTSSRYINLGEWITFRSYGVFDGEELKIQFYKNPDGKIFG